ncbi:MAG TPA: GNAT family N-acetyltransferase [Rhizomicrobium sp.]|nr:GNAT family N-acetyltransferase [Rhizomicrobium sp.]
MSFALKRREATPEDASAIIGWFPTRLEQVWWGGPTVPDPLTAEWLVEQFGLGRYWVWCSGQGVLQAVAGLRAMDGGLAWLNRFSIAPATRGQGLAAELMDEIIEIARRRGDNRMGLGVYGSNQIARRVYDRLGFSAVGERVAAEDPSGVSITMQRDL